MQQQLPPGLPQLITSKRLCERFGLSRSSIFRMTRDGRLPPARVLGNGQIRWHEDEIREWLNNLPSREYAAPTQKGKRGKAPTHHGVGHA
jgi:excisionase family DNA binding protein